MFDNDVEVQYKHKIKINGKLQETHFSSQVCTQGIDNVHIFIFCVTY